MPAIGSSAILRRTSRLTTCALGAPSPLAVAWHPARAGSSGRRRSRPAARRAACAARRGSRAWRHPRPSCSRARSRRRSARPCGSYEISHSSGRSFSATTKLERGAASYTADTRERRLAVERGGGIGLHQVQVGVEQRQRVRQVVGRHHPAPVARDRHVAHVQAGAHLGDDGEVPEVVLRDPAVARAEVDVAAVGRELRSAVQRIAAGEAVDALEAVAVDQRHVVVAAFDDDEQVHRVGAPHRLGRQVLRTRRLDARGTDVGLGPDRRRAHRRVDPAGQRADRVATEHARRRPASAWPGARRAMTFSASGLRRRSRLSGSSAGPMPPVRCAPWQAAQCCWYSDGGIGSGRRRRRRLCWCLRLHGSAQRRQQRETRLSIAGLQAHGSLAIGMRRLPANGVTAIRWPACARPISSSSR